ncbi:MAG TPA: hypothetical protein DEA50_00050 [Parvularcula sp.]|nr:hypothetical protein [Parvularcula sp.]
MSGVTATPEIETARPAAIEAAGDAADLADAFRLSVAEAVNRLLSISADERASNTDFERAARTALTFLKAAAEALALAAAKRKEDATHERGEKLRLPNNDELDRFEQLVLRKLAGRGGVAERRDAAGDAGSPSALDGAPA